MVLANILGAFGVFLLLFAYVLHLRNVISNTSKTYIFLNFFGAAIACASSVILRFYPFVVLEGIWAIVSVLPLLKNTKS